MMSSKKVPDLQKKNMIKPKKLNDINLFHTMNSNLETKKPLHLYNYKYIISSPSLMETKIIR